MESDFTSRYQSKREAYKDSIVNPKQERQHVIFTRSSCKDPSPVRDTNTRGKEQLETTPQSPPHLLGRHLRREDRNKHRRRPNPQPTNHPTDIKHVQAATVNNLQDTTDLENNTRNNKRPTSTKPLSNGPDEEATEESTRLEHADGIGVDGDTLGVSVVEGMLEGRESEDAADDAGVVGEEKGAGVVLVE